MSNLPVVRPPLWYDLLIRLIKPLYRWRVRRRSGHLADYADELHERFGPFQPAQHPGALWFHAVSVGETNAAQPLIEHYLRHGQPVLLTNTTRTGQARARSLFAQKYAALIQTVFLPIDQRQLIEQFVHQYQPRIVLLMETELWPNLLAVLAEQGIPSLLLNARLSERSAQGYARFGRLTRPMLQQLSAIAAQDEPTQQRFIQLGMRPERVMLVGNVKFDIQPPAPQLQQAQQIRQAWQLERRQIMVLASTHASEEQQILAALQPILLQQPELLCIVVPRHPERFDSVFNDITMLGYRVKRRSLQQQAEADTQVYLADSMGELWLWYALADVAFVGGSLNSPGGGHNILEPIALQVPTVLGKNYFNFQQIVDEFVQHDAVRVAQDVAQAAQYLLELLQQPHLAQAMQQRAQQILQRNQGAVARHLALIDQYLPQ